MGIKLHFLYCSNRFEASISRMDTIAQVANSMPEA